MRSCVRRLGIPAFTIDQARGLVADDGDLGFGYADPIFNRTFRELRRSDLVIYLGAHIDFHACFGGEQLMDPQCRIVQIHGDGARIGICRSNDLAIEGPVRPVFEGIVAGVAAKGPIAAHRAWHGEIFRKFSAEKASWATATREAAAADRSIHPLQVCTSLERVINANAVIAIDGGDFVHWPRAYFGAQKAGHWMDAVLTGNLGGALPLGIGAQVAFPHDPVWIFLGDGGFGFYAWELATAVERKLPIRVVVGNDAAWGIEKRLQRAEYGEDVGCDLPYTRYDRFAELVGAKGFHVDAPKQLDAAVRAMADCPGPCLLNVDIRRAAGRPLADFPRY